MKGGLMLLRFLLMLMTIIISGIISIAALEYNYDNNVPAEIGQKTVNIDGGSSIPAGGILTQGAVHDSKSLPETDDVPIPTFKFEIRNYPTPFCTPDATRRYMYKNMKVTLSIYNIHGQLVRKIYFGQLPQEPSILTWDGRDDRKNVCPNGIYFIKAKVGSKSETLKVVKLK